MWQMAEFTSHHDLFLVRAGKWIHAHGGEYCPTTAVKEIPGYRKLFDELHSMGLVDKYKSGNVIKIAPRGWDYLNERHPEITRRRRGGRIHLE